MMEPRVTIYDIQKDLESDKVLKTIRRSSARESSELVFDPDVWKGRKDELTF